MNKLIKVMSLTLAIGFLVFSLYMKYMHTPSIIVESEKEYFKSSGIKDYIRSVKFVNFSPLSVTNKVNKLGVYVVSKDLDSADVVVIYGKYRNLEEALHEFRENSLLIEQLEINEEESTMVLTIRVRRA